MAALLALKNQPKKPKKEKKEKKREKQVSPPIASSSRSNGKSKTIPKKRSTKKATIPDDDALSFEQKKDLSEAIGKLDGGEKLEKVISIIHEGVPEIRDVRILSIAMLSLSNCIYYRAQRRLSLILISYLRQCLRSFIIMLFDRYARRRRSVLILKLGLGPVD